MTFPAADRNLEDQLEARCFILSTIMLNKSFFFLPNNSGSPKYLPAHPSFAMPRWFLTLSLTEHRVLAENVIATSGGWSFGLKRLHTYGECPTESWPLLNQICRRTLYHLQIRDDSVLGSFCQLWCPWAYCRVEPWCTDQTRLRYTKWRPREKVDPLGAILFLA